MLRLVQLEDGVAVIASDLGGTSGYQAAITELKTRDAKDLATKSATKAGVASPAIGMCGNPYPVDVEGNVVGPGVSASKIDHYRIDIPVSATLG